MAKAKPQQQSSLKKLLFIGIPLIGIIFLIPTGPPEKKGQSKTQQLIANAQSTSSRKKEDPYNTPEDRDAKFEVIEASLKNSFVPLVTKRDANGPVARNGIPPAFADGEGTWTYTGNMTVNGTPNALLENSATGEGVFLRPGQRWKQLKLVTVREDSIEIEGPAGATKTVYFNDLNVTASAPEALSPLPPVFPSGTTASPANNGGNGNRPRRNGGFADNGGLSGPIGQTNAFEPSIDSQDPQTNQFNSRRNRNRRNNENNLN